MAHGVTPSPRRNVLYLSVVLVGLLSLVDCAAAFAPIADRLLLLPVASRTQSRPHHTTLFHSRNSYVEETLSSLSVSAGGISTRLHRSIAAIGTSAALFAATLAFPINVEINFNPNTPPSLVTVSRSQAWALTENQQSVADVWFAVTAQFFDPTFNGLGEDGWRLKEKEAIAAVADTGPDDDDAVNAAISNMLSALGDPYTRFLPREKYEALTAYATGGSSGAAGIGVQLLEDPRAKCVAVMATTKGGPAASAGVRAGDMIVEVDGQRIDDDVNAEVVAAKCRGEPGTKVDVTILHGKYDGEGTLNKEHKQESVERITITRAKINPNPIETSTFVSPGGKKVGLLRVPSFSTNTVREMVDGMRTVMSSRENDLDGKAVEAIAIDIRGNVGGYMPAGVDAAKLFLPSRAHIIAEIGPNPSSVKTYDADGIGAETVMPVYLLVDRRTASAAEIFAAALQDNRRALVVGSSNTFGKGRIQNVQPLGGGGVAVTRARYVTPRGRDLHGVGIAPNKEPSGRCEMRDDARSCLANIVDMY